MEFGFSVCSETGCDQRAASQLLGQSDFGYDHRAGGKENSVYAPWPPKKTKNDKLKVIRHGFSQALIKIGP